MLRAGAILGAVVLLTACGSPSEVEVDAGPPPPDAGRPRADAAPPPVTQVCEVLTDLDGDGTVDTGTRRSFAADGRELVFEQLSSGGEVEARFETRFWNENLQVLVSEHFDSEMNIVLQTRRLHWRTDGRPLLERYERADGTLRTETSWRYADGQLDGIFVDGASTRFEHVIPGRGAACSHATPGGHSRYVLYYRTSLEVESTRVVGSGGGDVCADLAFSTNRIVEREVHCDDRTTILTRTYRWDPGSSERTTTVVDGSGTYVSERWTVPANDRIEYVAYSDRGARVQRRTTFEGCGYVLGALTSVLPHHAEFISAGVALPPLPPNEPLLP